MTHFGFNLPVKFPSIPSGVNLRELWSNFTGFGSFFNELFMTASAKIHD